MKKARARIGSLGEDRLWRELHWLRAFEEEEGGKMELRVCTGVRAGLVHAQDREEARVLYSSVEGFNGDWCRGAVRQSDATVRRCGALKRRATTGRRQASGFHAKGAGSHGTGGNATAKGWDGACGHRWRVRAKWHKSSEDCRLGSDEMLSVGFEQ